MFRLLKYMTLKEWVLTVLALALIVLQVSLDLALPDYMEEITHLVETEGSSMTQIWSTGIKMLASALGSLVGAVLTVFLASYVAATFSATLRERLFDQISSFSGVERDRFTTPSLINRTTGDVLQVQLSFVIALEVLIKAPVKVIFAICKISVGDMHWALIAVVGTAVLLILTVECIAVCYPKFRKMQIFADDLNRITRENLQGLHAIRASGGEHFEEQRFERTNEKLTDTHLFTARTMSLLSPLLQLTNNVLSVVIYAVGALLINQALVEMRVELFSETVSFLSYMLQILSAFLLFAMATTLLPRAVVSARRICEVLHTVPGVREGTVTESPAAQHGELIFSHVTFRYPYAHEDALLDVSFSVKRGETVGIIGGSHSGKSVVGHLLTRHYDPHEGSVIVNGVDVKEYRTDALNRQIGYVDGEPFLFAASVRENIAFGNKGAREISEQRLAELVRMTGTKEMMDELPHGADTHVVEGGVNLSAGEAQHVAILRALCKEPDILVLDDALTAFDMPTVLSLQRSIRESRPSLTTLIIAKRVSTVRGADRIIVLDNGRVAGVGTHDELMTECPAYRRIANAQRLEVSDHA